MMGWVSLCSAEMLLAQWAIGQPRKSRKLRAQLAGVVMNIRFLIIPCCLCTFLSLSSGAVPTYTFTTVDFPGAIQTLAGGINNQGQVVGYYFPPSSMQGENHGFLLSGGVFTTITVGMYNTTAMGINDSGRVAGSYFDANTVNQHGFLKSGGTVTTIDFPGATGGTAVNGINNAGQVVGFYYVTNAAQGHCFLLSGGVYTSFDVPGATFCTAWGINNSGQVVGSYRDASFATHAFLMSGGVFTTIDFPGASGSTVGNGINDSGDIVGSYRLSGQMGDHGFLLRGGVFTTIDYPGSAPGNGSGAFGINNSGVVVGTFGPGASEHAYVATPAQTPPPPPPPPPPGTPLPPSVILTLTGLAGVGLYQARRLRRSRLTCTHSG